MRWSIPSKASSVSEKRLKAEALRYGVGSVLPHEVAGIAREEGVIGKDFKGQLMTTTQKTLDTGLAILQFAHDGQRKFRPMLKDESAGATLAGLSEEQRKAALHVLKSRDQVVGVRGGAGTGKTHMLQTVNAAIISSIEHRSGQDGSGDYSKVSAFAQSSTASRGELRKVGFRDAETLARLFKSEQLQSQLHKQVMLVDEAGLVSSNDMRKLFDIAKKQEARVILVGDYRQHASVEAGDAFRLLESEGGVRYAELKEIRRQKDPKYRKAVEEISKGTASGAKKGFDRLDKMGAIVEARGEERHQMLINDYLKAAEDGKSALIIAPTHAEGERLTAGLREALKARGVIGTEKSFTVRKGTGWTKAQKGDFRNYQPGMVLEFNQNEKGFTKGEKAVVVTGGNDVLLMKQDGTQAALPMGNAERFEVYRVRDIDIGKGDRIRVTRNGLARVEGQAKGTKINNGDIYNVEGFTKEGDIRLGGGKLLNKGYGHFAPGYVDTSYASQGKTVDRVFIALGNMSLAAANLKQWYVSISRGREMAKVYVEDKQEVRDTIARNTDRLSASN